ncbi:hypothetical protein BCR33DRAFT_736214 [Rhizoclosmatium globosum]|uniref:Uncharacterized protein n=1 Tax=Rhizoclosmatium globosum TaxID=329046 RepID=A0A1Y2CK83_9FUNG|nr:hypothetical protein BCR33DRAFT_736213 [Rhizoclosmatium globosum]ORY47400.1 hypothetical protein BCR33DRAFT_736214 [Rhizoclosmatium globosum]|eukprot:ORY47399.1 hypothetical protein BCR33DRAFT_736213 [Rhizoclosmatium globosum]
MPAEPKMRTRKTPVPANTSAVPVDKKARKPAYIWDDEIADALLDVVQEDWDRVHSKNVSVTKEYWAGVPPRVAYILGIDVHHQDLVGMTGDTCRNKWKALKSSTSSHADDLRGVTGTGTEPDDEPDHFEKVMSILGLSAAAKGFYQSRNTISPGLKVRQESPASPVCVSVVKESSVTPITKAIQDLVSTSRRDLDVVVVPKLTAVLAPRGEKLDKGAAKKEENKRKRQNDAAEALEGIRKSGNADGATRTPKPNKKKAPCDGMTEFQEQQIEVMKESNRIQTELLEMTRTQNQQAIEQHEQQIKNQEAKRNQDLEKAEEKRAQFMAYLRVVGGGGGAGGDK